MDTAWLIETTDTVQWWDGGNDEVCSFTSDPDKAIRFVRKEDAESVIKQRGMKYCRATQHAWIPPFEFGKACQHGQLARQCETCDALVLAADWRQKFDHLSDMWRVIGESLKDHCYVRPDESSDVWPARVEGLLKEVAALRDRENRFASVLKERDDQTNHAIRVNREEARQEGYECALQDIGYTISVGMIAAERRRQVEGESWTSAHDDGQDAGQLALAAACYAIESAGRGSVEYRLGHGGGIEISVDALGLYWPWAREWWKPTTAIRSLVKAGALISAEIDRRLRAGEDP